MTRFEQMLTQSSNRASRLLCPMYVEIPLAFTPIATLDLREQLDEIIGSRMDPKGTLPVNL